MKLIYNDFYNTFISTINLSFFMHDIVIVTAETYDDHPLCPTAIIKRVLEAKKFSVKVIEKPKDFSKIEKPKLCFCVTTGTIDSMVFNYTSLKKKRVTDMPDRALLYYCNKMKHHFKGVPLVIGGVEASLRRFAHYDYWDNNVRKSILLDSKANILVYGNGEKQIIEIAERLKDSKDLRNIKGSCILSKELPKDFEVLPSFEDIKHDKIKFCKSHVMFSVYSNLAQEYDNNYVLQYKYPEYTQKDLDWIYSLPFTRDMHKNSPLKMAQFTIVTHRGCYGKCNFCSITNHQGNKIISRSEENILDEIKRITKHVDFKGYIDDLGGPTANMYATDLGDSKKRMLSLLRKARKIQGIKKIFIRSGVRYDIADREYIEEISKYHISGTLKIAPEHFSQKVLKLMNKSNNKFNEFYKYFKSINPKQDLRYYFMIGHPGETIKETYELEKKLRILKNIENFQLFTPTPMTISSCMYWTGLNPFTLEKIHVVYDYNTKKRMKKIILNLVEKRVGK